MLSGGALALFATLGVLGFFFLRSVGVIVQVLPLGDGFEHNGQSCECLPQILLSFGRTYVVHHDLRDSAGVQFDFS